MKVVKESHRLKPLFRFITRLKRNAPRGLQSFATQASNSAWDGIDCLSCANCCKTMTPTYKNSDIKRIASYLKISTEEMKKKWLKRDRGTVKWLNKTTPCQFLDLKTNMCNVYEVRPTDCAGFPHLTKKRIIEYIDMHKENLDQCPATFKMVEKMNEMVNQQLAESNQI